MGVDREPAQALAALRERLRRAQAEAGISWKQVAARTGLGRTTVSQAVNDGNPPPSARTVATLARALRIDNAPLLDLLDTAVPASRRSEGMARPAVTDRIYQLPAPPAALIGREEQHAMLLEVLRPDSASPTVVAVGGMAGVGKTALALSAAHEALVRGWFTDVLFLDLRSYDQQPTTSDQALESLLAAFDSVGGELSALPDARAGQYRSQLTRLALEGRRVLIVADNASASEQVRPLLPAPGPHRLMVTSREVLAALDARLVALRALAPEAAADLLRNVLLVANPGDSRAEEDDSVFMELAQLCGCLPLALRIAAAVLITDCSSVAELVIALTQGRSVLPYLHDGARGVRASFDLSYRLLERDQAALFCLLSLSPGPDFSLEAAAALTNTSPADVRLTLRSLARSHFLDQGGGRWSMHDLVRDYARERAREEAVDDPCTAAAHRAAFARLLQFYSDTAAAAAEHLGSTAVTSASGRFSDRSEALIWLEAERANITATIVTACEHGESSKAARLFAVLGEYFDRKRYFDEWLMLATTLRDEATEPSAQAIAWSGLGVVLRRLRRFDEAAAAHVRARDIYRAASTTQGEALACSNLGLALADAERPDEAVRALQKALTIYQELGEPVGQAHAWSHLGTLFRELGRPADAAAACRRACDIFRRFADLHGEANASVGLAMVLFQEGQLEESCGAYARARDLYQQLGDQHCEAGAWEGLAGVLHTMGRGEATAAYSAACRLYAETGDHGAEAQACFTLAYVLAQAREPEMVTALMQAASAHQNAGNYLEAINIWDCLAEMHARRGSLKEAQAAQTAAAAARRLA